jgi:hypothetical protein
MRNVLIAAFSIVAFAGSANAAAPKHKWFGLNYGTGSCDPVPLTPEQFYTAINATHAETGSSIDRISPGNVTKDDKGEIHVHMTGATAAGSGQWDFFTSRDECANFISDNGIKAEQAAPGDIN